MPDRIRLTLMIGPAVPVPVPEEVLEALTGVQVTTSGVGASGFQLTFKLSPRSPLQTLFLVAGGATPPLMRVVIIVTMGSQTQTLIDGVMTHHQIQPGTGDKAATLTVTGEDLSKVMDYIDFTGFPFPAMPPEVRVLLMLAKYAMFGVIPKVIPSVLIDVPIPVDRIPVQQGTDLAYIKQLAEEVGYVFYMEPGPAPGTSFAYWGPQIKVGVPQSAVNLDLDKDANLDSLDVKFDSEGKELPILWIHNQITKIPIPIPVPDISPLNPPLGLIPPIPKSFPPVSGTGKMSPIRAALIGMAKASQSSDAVTANGTLNVVRYGRILKARELVGVRGAGEAFDGLYYVTSVTHNIQRGEYKQSFSLSRNGLVSITSKVVP